MIKENTIGQILKKSRERNNLTQQELASMTYLSRQAISKYELDISSITVEKLLVLLDSVGASISLENGKIKLLEVKDMKTFGFIKINALTAKVINENYDEILDTFKLYNLDLVNIFELKESEQSSSNYKTTLDKGIYITVDFKRSGLKQEDIDNPYSNNKEDSNIIDILKNIQEKLHTLNISFLTYYPSSIFKNLNREEISFNDDILVKNKFEEFFKDFNPNNYDYIYPTPRAGYLRIKKDNKYGFIDALTGEEMISPIFDFVEAFDYMQLDNQGNMFCRARINGKNVIIDRYGNIY